MAVKTKPYDAAMVGFGSGMGAHYLLADPLLKHLDCVEIEEEMMDLAKGFLPWNYRGYDDPRIEIHIDDAGTFFHTRKTKYDLIISVPSNPWVSGVASLFSHEFYSKMRRYLKPGGLWVQWIQTYEFNDLLFLHILKALDVVFPHVSLYKAPEEPDIIIIASDMPVYQEGIERFYKDSLLVKEFETIKRSPEFFGEANFLFTSEMVSSLLEGIAPNSTFTPIVDNKAEEARFVNSDAHIVEIFDSCEVCWQEYLDKDEFEKRRPAKVKALASKKTPYVENSLLHYLDTRTEAITDSSKEWQAFRIDYIEWVRDIPLELRAENAVYQKMLELYSKEFFPKSFQMEFGITESARQKDWPKAALQLAEFYEVYEIKEMDDFFLRNAILISLLAEEPELAFVIYKEAILSNDNFYPVEKRLMEREIQKLRAENLKKRK